MTVVNVALFSIQHASFSLLHCEPHTVIIIIQNKANNIQGMKRVMLEMICVLYCTGLHLAVGELPENDTVTRQQRSLFKECTQPKSKQSSSMKPPEMKCSDVTRGGSCG